MEVIKSTNKENTNYSLVGSKEFNDNVRAQREALLAQANNNGVNNLQRKGGVLLGMLKVPGQVRMQIISTYDAGTSAKRIAFCPGDHPTTASLADYNYTADAILTDGYAVGDVTDGINVLSTKSGLKVEQFMRFIKRNAFLLESLLIETDNADFFSQIVDYGTNLPFAKSDEDDLDLNEYISAFQKNEKKAEINLKQDGKEMLMNAESVLLWPIPAATSAFFTLRGTFYVPVYG